MMCVKPSTGGVSVTADFEVRVSLLGGSEPVSMALESMTLHDLAGSSDAQLDTIIKTALHQLGETA
jgi:hypothetical protein